MIFTNVIARSVSDEAIQKKTGSPCSLRSLAMTHLFFIFLCALCVNAFLVPQPAHATEPPPPTALAMHGTAKFPGGGPHLDYANPNAPKGGTLKTASIGTFDTVNPYTIKGKAADGLSLVYDRLMARSWDEPFTMYPLIAESYYISRDRSEISFSLNPNARFHDGTPITPDDVIFSFETLHKYGRPNMRRIYDLVKEYGQISGNSSVYFKFGEGYDQETALILSMMPVLSKAYWQDKEFDTTTLTAPLSNGPYKIKSIDPGRRIVYERIKDYWAADLLANKGHYNFNEIIYEYYRDDNVAFEAFKAGDVNYRRELDAGQWASAYDFPALRDGKIIKEDLPHGRPERVRGMIFNTRRAPFDDIRVREALGLLFDFDWANENLFHGAYKRINSYFPNSELAAPQPKQEETSPRLKMRQADQLLKEAGWLVENGKRVKDGKEFTFEIILDSPEDEKIALHFKRALERMGITMTIRPLDTAAFRGRLNEYDFDMVLYYWQNSLSPGTEQMLYWSCEAGKQPARWNFAGICDPEIDALAAGIAQAKTREDLVQKTRTLDAKLMAGHYMIPLYYAGYDMAAYWKPIKHPENTPLYGLVLETWWMDTPEGE